MLKRWTLENFKSFSGKATFDFSPITVLAGANSSGKSTVIQGILVIKQTIQHGAPQRSVALNGPILRLGRFDDIHNVDSSDQHFGLGWELSDGVELEEICIAPSWYFPVYSRRETPPEKASLYSTFQVQGPLEGDEIARLYPSLQSCEVTFSTVEEEEEFYFDVEDEEVVQSSLPEDRFLKIERSTESPRTKLSSQVPNVDEHQYEEYLKFDVVESDRATNTDLVRFPNSKILGSGARQFFPSHIAVSYDRANWKANRIARAIVQMSPRAMSGEVGEEKIPDPVIELLRARIREEATDLDLTNEFLPPNEDLAYTAAEVVESLRNLSRAPVSRQRRLLRGLLFSLEDLQGQIADLLLQSFGEEMAIHAPNPGGFREVETYARDYFSNKIQYLGPLRDEPKPLYPLESLANTTDVGFKGEHTAAVLDLNRDRYVASIDIRKFSDEGKFVPQRQHLGQAVANWLEYLGVAVSVVTTDRGKIGHELQVNTAEIDKSHDLTNVGVGVSQVLPIVVMALLADKGSLLIFEQPELHLHPKVQARLGDFFLAMALLGKQSIVETHSEYLVERFRRRIAEDETDRYRDIVSVYFFEQKKGHTLGRQVEINEYGAVLNWPKDFFDQASEETERIFAAATEKKRLRSEISSE